MPPEVTGETAAARHITSSLMVAIVPPSGRLAYVSAPPCCCTIDRAMTTPRPVPFLRVVKNGVPSPGVAMEGDAHEKPGPANYSESGRFGAESAWACDRRVDRTRPEACIRNRR